VDGSTAIPDSVSPMLDKTTILVIDDEQIIRESCSRILSEENFEVLTVDNGKQGVLQVQADPGKFDLILLDLMMPGMSGTEVLDQVRNLDPGIIVIVITAYATIESAVEVMKKGAYDFVPKPFTPDQLRITVERGLERRALQKEAEFLRKEREKSLRDIATEKSKLRTIINSMGDGVLVCDGDGSLVLTNPAASRMLKMPEESLLGKFVSQSPLPADLAQALEENLNEKEAAYASISRDLSVGDTGEVFLRAHTASVRDDLGRRMGSVTVLQDISRLKELDRMKSEFIALVAHELRAPIAAVEQQLTVILNKMAGEVTEKQEQLLSRAKERTLGLLNLIKDLLDLSRIEEGKMVQYKEPLFLGEVVEKVVEFMKTEAESRKINLRWETLLPLSKIDADRNSMEEIFTNLISNSIKFTPEGGKIILTLCDEGGFVKAVVSDTGIGIKKEYISKVFDRFFRARTPETRGITGTGLGLAIVKSIVEAHLGSISVESEVGKGTTVTLLFPKAPECSSGSLSGEREI
jgi:two-component system, OmpR family, phosphate regulon sensor histidine kinase PhoR